MNIALLFGHEAPGVYSKMCIFVSFGVQSSEFTSKQNTIGSLSDSEIKMFLPDDVSHQEAERVFGGGAEVLPIYCYLLRTTWVGRRANKVGTKEENLLEAPAESFQLTMM